MRRWHGSLTITAAILTSPSSPSHCRPPTAEDARTDRR